MSDAIFTQFATGMATLNTALNNTFARDAARCFLLKRTQQKGSFTSVVELTSGFYVDYGELREDIKLYYSTTADYQDTWIKSTHIGYGIPNGNEVFVFEIQADQRDRLSPDVFNSDFKAYAVRLANERYAIPEA